MESINVRARSKSYTPAYIYLTANKKGKHDAIIADLDRNIKHLADVLEPINRMDVFQISPDLDKDIRALIISGMYP